MMIGLFEVGVWRTHREALSPSALRSNVRVIGSNSLFF